jgi:inosine-uridine nucleoside N-ribohydrolase
VVGLVVLASCTAGCLQSRRIPVILDTDIGGDIDDTWALAFVLASPELDLKLVVTDSHNARGKAKIAAKFLERAGRTDVPVGMGLTIDDEIGPQAPWVEGYDLAGYPGRVHDDGVRVLIDTIMRSPQPITLITIGPVPNIGEALRREPRIAGRARLVAMGGSVERQFGNQPGRCAETNVVTDVPASQAAYRAAWDITLTPLDTAGIAFLRGEAYARVRDSRNPRALAIMENYRIWAKGVGMKEVETQSSCLFDTVAVYLAFAHEFCEMRDLTIKVTDQGFTEPDPQGKLMHVAMAWKDLDGFGELLARRLEYWGKWSTSAALADAYQPTAEHRATMNSAVHSLLEGQEPDGYPRACPW